MPVVDIGIGRRAQPLIGKNSRSGDVYYSSAQFKLLNVTKQNAYKSNFCFSENYCNYYLVVIR